MHAQSGTSSAFVVAWRDDGRSEFSWDDDVRPARDLFERTVQRLAPGQNLMELRRSYGTVREPGGALWSAAERLPVSFFHAYHLETLHEPTLFACARVGPRTLPLLGPRASVDALLANRAPVASVDRYGLAVAPPSGTPAKIRSRAKATRRAQSALVALTAEAASAREALAGLTTPELLWIGSAARQQGDALLGYDVALHAAHVDRNPDTLNLQAAVLRDLGFYDRSVDTFRESLRMCASAEFNPHAHIGLAASLRRTGDIDEAYDHAKRARRWYPDDKYVNHVLDALRRTTSDDPAPAIVG